MKTSNQSLVDELMRTGRPPSFEEVQALLKSFIGHDLIKAVSLSRENGVPVLLHQDSFAADYREEEMILLGLFLCYAVRQGVTLWFRGENRETLKVKRLSGIQRRRLRHMIRDVEHNCPGIVLSVREAGGDSGSVQLWHDEIADKGIVGLVKMAMGVKYVGMSKNLGVLVCPRPEAVSVHPDHN